MRPKHAPRIRLVRGQWYAFPGQGPKSAANLLLVPAINFCRRLNDKRKPKP